MLQKGDTRGLTLFDQAYGPGLNGIVRRIIRDEPVAEEAYQDVLLKVWSKIDQYDESKSTLFTWVGQIARNTALDKVRLKRYEQRQKTKPIDPLVHFDDSMTDHQSTHHLDVEKLVGGMDEKYRDVLDMMYLKGYTAKAAAEHMEIPIGTIKTRLRKAVQILRNNLRDEKALFMGATVFIFLLILWLCQ